MLARGQVDTQKTRADSGVCEALCTLSRNKVLKSYVVVEWVRRLGREGCASRGEQVVEDLGASSDEDYVD